MKQKTRALSTYLTQSELRLTAVRLGLRRRTHHALIFHLFHLHLPLPLSLPDVQAVVNDLVVEEGSSLHARDELVDGVLVGVHGGRVQGTIEIVDLGDLEVNVQVGQLRSHSTPSD